MICPLKGSVLFMADLSRKIKLSQSDRLCLCDFA